jgi:hypothetical protein
VAQLRAAKRGMPKHLVKSQVRLTGLGLSGASAALDALALPRGWRWAAAAG